MESGYIYLLVNKHMPGLCKIGHTTRDPRTRANELSSHTGVPGKFEIFSSWAVKDSFYFEQKLFSHLKEFRVDGGEFFKAPDLKMKATITALLDLWDASLYESVDEEYLENPIVKSWKEIEKSELISVVNNVKRYGIKSEHEFYKWVCNEYLTRMSMHFKGQSVPPQLCSLPIYIKNNYIQVQDSVSTKTLEDFLLSIEHFSAPMK